MFTRYAVEIGDALWSAIHSYLIANYPGEDEWCSQYRVEGIYEEGGQKFTILQDRKTSKFVRMNFSLTEASGFEPQGELVAVDKTFTPSATPQFALEDVEKFESEFKAAKIAEQEPAPADPEPTPAQYNLDEIPEYVELQTKYSELESKVNELETTLNSLKENNETLTTENTSLKEFKLGVEKEAKEDMINNTFFMLSEEDKKDVIENINTYSLEEIEAKLSVICVRNKVNFNLDNEEHKEEPAPGPTIYNLDDTGADAATPAWIQAVLETAKNRH